VNKRAAYDYARKIMSVRLSLRQSLVDWATVSELNWIYLQFR